MAGDKRDTEWVQYLCQSCSVPLVLDDSFREAFQEGGKSPEEIISEILELSSLKNQIETELGVDVQAENEKSDVQCKIIKARDKFVNSIKFPSIKKLKEAVDSKKMDSSSSHCYSVTTSLFDLLSSRTPIDHPLCEECADQVLAMMDEHSNNLEEECAEYDTLLNDLKNQKEEIDVDELESQIKALALEESEIMEKLQKLFEEKKLLEVEELKVEQEEKELLKEEANYYRQYVQSKYEILRLEDQLKSLNNQLTFAQTHANALVQTNIFNLTFHIWYQGKFGTINGFRLGTLPDDGERVECQEINSAYGQACLLLYSLAKKINLTFERYRLVPFGSHSYIEVLPGSQKGQNSSTLRQLPLYNDGNFTFLWDSSFDDAQVAFLDCLKQFKTCIEKNSSSEFYLPYSISGKFIKDKQDMTQNSTGGHSREPDGYRITLEGNNHVVWTKACKHMLTNLKWGLAFVSSQYSEVR